MKRSEESAFLVTLSYVNQLISDIKFKRYTSKNIPIALLTKEHIFSFHASPFTYPRSIFRIEFPLNPFVGIGSFRFLRYTLHTPFEISGLDCTFVCELDGEQQKRIQTLWGAGWLCMRYTNQQTHGYFPQRNYLTVFFIRFLRILYTKRNRKGPTMTRIQVKRMPTLTI